MIKGVKPKPLQLVLAEGNKNHLSKADIENNIAQSKSVYTGVSYKELDETKNNPIAHKEFMRLKRLYGKIEYIDGLDEQIINRYCLLLAEEKRLEKSIETMREEVKQVKNNTDMVQMYRTIASSVSSLCKVRDNMLRLEDRLLLNPVSRMRAIPKRTTKGQEEDPMEALLKGGT